MNAHQRRKARRAKDREPWSVVVFDDEAAAWSHALKFGTAFYRVQPNIDIRPLLTGAIGWVEGVPLIRGEIGTIEG